MKLRIFSALLAFFGLCDTATATPSENGIPRPNLAEASTNFDMTDIEPFFKTLCHVFEEGFGEREVAQVKKLAEKALIEKCAMKEFTVKFKGETSIIYIRVFMDDVDSPDVYVFASKKVTDVVQAKMNEYSDTLGR